MFIKLYKALSDHLKYSITPGAGPGQLQDMLAQFQSKRHAIDRMGGPNADMLVRHQLADALMDQGDRPGVEHEVALLMNPNAHVMVHSGTVIPATYTREPIRHIVEQINTLLGRNIIVPILYGPRDRYGSARATHINDTESEYHLIHHSEIGDYYANEINNRLHTHEDRPEVHQAIENLRNTRYEDPVL